MVICAKACRYFTTILLVAVIHTIPQVKCKRNVPEEFIRSDASNQEQTQELVESTEELGELFITQAAGELQNEADAEEYSNYSSPLQGEHGDYSYLQDESPQPCCCAPGRSKKYTYLIVIGAVILLLFCLCACVCHSRSKDNKKRSSSLASSWTCCDRHAKDSSKTCMINLLGPPPDLSDSETDHLYRMPLPLIYDDKGKICNNAEMFIQRCMTSSIKRTYSEPVKNSIPSKPLFEEYLKELANLREKQQRESQKRGAVKAFIKELLQATKKATGGKKKEKTSRITDGSTPTEDNHDKSFSKRKSKYTRKEDKDSSSSISITSVLLKPKYQNRYYTNDQSTHAVKGAEQDAVEPYRADTNECIEYVPQTNGTPRGISDTQTIEDSRKFEMSRDIQTQMDDSEELIRCCVNSLRDSYKKKFKNIYESLNSQHIDKLQAFAGTIAKRMALDKYNYGRCMIPGRENNYMDLEKSNTTTTDSRGIESSEKLMQEETSEVFDALMKKLFTLVKKRNNLHSNEAFSNDHPILEDLKYATEEEARIKMREKYLELQKEVERLDKSMRKFALDFVFSESSKHLESSDDTRDFSINTNPSMFESSACTIVNTEGMCD